MEVIIITLIIDLCHSATISTPLQAWEPVWRNENSMHSYILLQALPHKYPVTIGLIHALLKSIWSYKVHSFTAWHFALNLMLFFISNVLVLIYMYLS